MATQRDAVSIGDVIPEKMCLSSADIDVVAATALTDGGVVASLALPQSSCTGGTSGKGSDLREYTSISPIPRRSVALDEDAAVLSNGVNLQLRARRHSLTNANDPSSWYKLHQLLGQGSFGQVWRAVDRITSRQLAVKIYKSAKLKNLELKKLVEAEVRIMKTINHPGIVSLIDTHSTYRGLHIVMDYAERGSLFAYLRKLGRMDEMAACFVFRQVASALHHLQCKNVAHRDIKLENILFFTPTDVKVVDFGLAAEMRSGNPLLTTICGSLLYMAPEMFRGKAYNGRFVDVWSLGVVLFLMANGRFPYRGSTEAEVKRKVLTEKLPEMSKSLSSDCVDLLRRMLTKKPEDRITIAEVCAHPWTTQFIPPEYRLSNLEEGSLYRPAGRSATPPVVSDDEPMAPSQQTSAPVPEPASEPVVLSEATSPPTQPGALVTKPRPKPSSAPPVKPSRNSMPGSAPARRPSSGQPPTVPVSQPVLGQQQPRRATIGSAANKQPQASGGTGAAQTRRLSGVPPSSARTAARTSATSSPAKPAPTRRISATSKPPPVLSVVSRTKQTPQKAPRVESDDEKLKQRLQRLSACLEGAAPVVPQAEHSDAVSELERLQAELEQIRLEPDDDVPAPRVNIMDPVLPVLSVRCALFPCDSEPPVAVGPGSREKPLFRGRSGSFDSNSGPSCTLLTPRGHVNNLEDDMEGIDVRLPSSPSGFSDDISPAGRFDKDALISTMTVVSNRLPPRCPGIIEFPATRWKSYGVLPLDDSDEDNSKGMSGLMRTTSSPQLTASLPL